MCIRDRTIAAGLAHRPSLVFLDEPTTGLDPQARVAVWELINGLRAEGMAVVLTTHYMDEAERLCDRLVVMDKAKIVAEGSPRSLIERYSTREVLELRFPDELRGGRNLAARLKPLAERVEELSDRMQLYTSDGEKALQDVHALGVPLESAVVRRSTLEDVFLRITGRGLAE